MTSALIGIFVLYGFLVLLLYVGWVKACTQKMSGVNPVNQFISVIVPVRNEEKTIGLLLNDLIGQNYPDDKFEIIFVDDHSEDNSGMIMYDATKHASNCKLLKLEGTGKKAAITFGVQQAKGQIIVTTDGDCRVSENLIQSINSAFKNDSIKMVFGGVKIESEQSLFSKMQAIEFSSLIGSGAATIAFGIPTMCNGANLAFRKKVFEEVNGYAGNENVASGDDEFLMRKISAKYADGIHFNQFPGSIVLTKAQASIAHFFNQRIRWAGKWKYHSDAGSKLLALYIFIFHASVLMMPALWITGQVSGDMLLSFLLVKLIVEFVFLSSVTSWLKIPWSWLSFIVLQIAYSFYAVGVGLASLFVSPVWKGRK